MQHTVDTLMALADDAAEKRRQIGEPAYNSVSGQARIARKARKALRKALTEALAPKKPVPTGCTSNCGNCTYAHGSPAQAGYCYMFYDEPQGVCSQWKDANPTIQKCPEKDNSVQPVREPANTPLLALREARTRLEWFIDSYPHDIAVSKATFFAGIDEAIATFSQPVREPLTAQVLPDFSPIFGGDK